MCKILCSEYVNISELKERENIPNHRLLTPDILDDTQPDMGNTYINSGSRFLVSHKHRNIKCRLV